MTDIMSIKKLPSLVIIIRGLKSTTIEYLSSKNEISLVTSVNKIVSYYKSHGVHVVTMLLDPEFQLLEEKVFSATHNKTGECDHVSESGRQIQVIKERMQAHHANIPFTSFTRRMTIELTKHIVMFLNAFPPKRGLSNTYTQRTIMTGKALNWKKSCNLHFGAYVQVHGYRNVANTLEEKTQRSICLRPTGNLQGTYILFLLRSDKKMTRGQFAEVPTPTIVIKRVASMAIAKNRTQD